MRIYILVFQMLDSNLIEFSSTEVKEHRTARSSWIIVNNNVYDVTGFLFDHPGGEEFILQNAGKDCTQIMKDTLEHFHSESAYEILSSYQIGTLKTDEKITKQEIDDKKSTLFINPMKPMLRQVWQGNFTKKFYLEQVHIPRHTKESAPIFDYPALEILTKTPWFVIPIVWLPVVVLCTYIALQTLSTWHVAMLFLTGIVNWSILEYSIHRFVFHVDTILPDNKVFLTLHFLTHGIHHFLPMDRMRLVMPPALSIILSYPIWNLYSSFLDFDVCIGLASGTYMGYIAYDLVHYYMHHGKPYGDHLKEMKTYHLDHHYKESNLGFGITSKVWDRVFNTLLL